jgi:hypothetical protein
VTRHPQNLKFNERRKMFMKKITEAILRKYRMERSDLYNDDRVIEIVEGELIIQRLSKKHLGEVLDNLFYILTERAEIQEEQ